MRVKAVFTNVIFYLLLCTGIQGASWYKYYDKAKDDMRKHHWKEAIDNLNKALAENPKPARSTLGEGNFPTEYFPHYYLAIAHLRLGNLEEAKRNFSKARETNCYRDDLAQYQQELEEKLAALEKSKAVPLNPRFQPLVEQARAALGAKRHEEALSKLEEARKLEPNEFKKLNLQESIDEANRFIKEGHQLATDGQKLLSEGNLADAKKKFEEAERELPKQKVVADGLSEIGKREQGVARLQHGRDLTNEGQKLLSEGNLSEAKKKLTEAEKILADDKALKTALEEIVRREQKYGQLKSDAERDVKRGHLTDAQRKYREAKDADPSTFKADGLDAHLDAIGKRLGAKSTIDAAVRVFDSERYSEAAALFRSIVQKEPTNTAALGYLKRAESREYLQNGRQLASQRQYQQAEQMFKAAVDKDGDNKEAADRLQRSRNYADMTSRARTASRGRKMEEARDLARRAMDLDPERLRQDKDVAQFLEGERPPAEQPEIRRALQALFHGQVQESIAALEKIRKNGIDKNPDLHAYLGAAYATAALLSSNQAESAGLRKKAAEEFRRVLSLRKDYQLSQRLFSPRIIAIFNEARASS